MNHKVFNRMMLILFMLFIVIYFSSSAGVIDYNSKNKKELTEQEIAKFEEDIKNGKSIDISSYNESSSKYNNGLSKAILSVSDGIGGVVNDIVDYLFTQMEKSMDKREE